MSDIIKAIYRGEYNPKARNAINRHVDEDDALKRGVIDSVGRMQDTVLINKSGMYRSGCSCNIRSRNLHFNDYCNQALETH